ncbi:ketopantoate reductase family protein [Oceanobacillus manasiensis]|uniref:ketopantoate reductase family protein n=1 Tax=Oceanobacillus manasiensis TaxID=586413 RepID=UPI0005A6C405|nr:ketopantoate reductase family protein [Oceanobacillus manasiensis]
MKVVIAGAGALGGYFGARLHETGAEVTFLVREKRAAQLKEQGLHISSKQGDYTIKQPNITTDVSSIPEADLVLAGVKGYHLDGILDPLKVLSEKGAYVLPVLNGIEHIELLQQHLGKEAILGGLSFIIATLDNKGHVIHSSDFHDLIFGPLYPEQREVCEKLKALFDKANFHATLTENILQEMWKKYSFINAFSGITTATNLAIGEIRKHPETFQIAKELLKEMKQLANAYGAELKNEHIEGAKKKLLTLEAEATSSMHQDRRKGLQLELDHLHGGAIRLAEKAEVNLPYTKTIYGIIKPVDKT